MLPDLRVLLVATITTFLLATGAGLYASVRLLPEPMTATLPDRDTPISRVALSWQDMNQPMKREVIPAAIRDVIAPTIERPFSDVVPADSVQNIDSTVPTPAPEIIAAKPSEPAAISEQAKDNPLTTGAISQPNALEAAPQPAPASEQPKVAARPDPAEAASHLPSPPLLHAPIRVKPKKAKQVRQAKPVQPRRNRVVRRLDPNLIGTVQNDSNGNFFTDFGSRMNR